MPATKHNLQTALEAADGRPSGFDYMRLILAVAVMLGHSVVTAKGVDAGHALWDSPARPFLRAILPMFFALSGFLVAGSMERCKSVVTFLGLRAIRIYPALAVEVLLSALVIGPLLTIVPLRDYFTSHLFVQYLLNVTGDIHFQLPGLFLSNPQSNLVNGQLWTVPFELSCYIVLTVLILAGARRWRFLPAMAAVAVTAEHAWKTASHNNGVVAYDFQIFPGSLLIVAFLIGVSLYLYRRQIPWSAAATAILTVASVVALWVVPYGEYFAAFSLAYVTVALGLCNPKRIGVIRAADYSYGIFLYGYVIQQMVMDILPGARTWYWNMLICLPLAAVFAAGSWHIVEKPALKLRRPLTAFEGVFLQMRARLLPRYFAIENAPT